ncbi:MAG: RNA polymerase sigma factor [Gemmataceae bacterium]|nr:RNA polymerase sigma factor [Gemmataceae bacterium]
MFRPAVAATEAGSRNSPASPPQIRDLSTWTDQQLLAEFLARRDQEAFAQVAARYGGMVFRTCLRLLHNSHDSEDATQAVFLLLARHPGRAQGSLAGWLYKAAHDTAVTLLRSRFRRERREEAAAMQKPPISSPPDDDLRRELDSAIGRLPTQLREAVILCHLEGHRQEEAARLLGCHQGTLSRRAMDGLNRLRATLLRRGVAVTSAVLITFLAQQKVSAVVPASLAGNLKLAGGAGAASAPVAALADATLRAAALAKAKLAAAIVLAVAVLGTGAALLLRSANGPPDKVPLVHFNGPALPVNKLGDHFPRFCAEPDGSDGGVFQASLDGTDAIAGSSLLMRLTQGRLKVQFDPEEKGKKTFARDYAAESGTWRFDTYNRLRFWLKVPSGAAPHRTDGGANMNVGTYVKRVREPNWGSLDEGGSSFQHRINVPALDCWTVVLINAHPSLERGKNPSKDVGSRLRPTGEDGVNFFDALTRFYVEALSAPAQYPVDYRLDEVEFIRQSEPENDEQVYGITATVVQANRRLIVTWNRAVEEDAVKHEVRYAFTSIHRFGWEKATPAPGGIVAPSGRHNASSMVYDTTELPLSRQSVVYIAIRPQNSRLFSQIEVPLNLR